MLNWSTDEEKMKKENPAAWRRWRLIQLIDFGLDDGEKLDKKEVIENWPKIKNEIDPYKKRLIEFLIWGKLYSLPPNLTCWNWHPTMQE